MPSEAFSSVALVALLLTAAVLLPSVSGQGLAIPDASIGAGEIATASEFERYEETLSLQLQTAGARGGGNKGKGGSGSGSGGGVGESFKQLKTMEQLQLSMYYTAAAPAVFETANTSTARARAMPQAVDQGDCSTCVGQAIATAMQMSAAKTLRQDVSKWAVSAPIIYYCSKGGRTCKTGWDIQEALNFVIDEAPELILPARCVDKNGHLSNTGKDLGITQWAPICRDAAAAQDCAQYTRQSPWLTCTYKSLSNFYQIQQHIRNHGAVISRMTVYSDFELFFNSSARTQTGLEWPPYRFNQSAVPLFGHAALIVGYDSNNYTWTILNSWGTGDNTENSRRGVTKDGTFRIAMGVAGVGVPDQTYGVECIPSPGREPNLHGTQPWTKRMRKPVELINPKQDKRNLNASCYHYKFQRGDTVASVVDHFGISMQQFVRANQKLFGTPQDVSYKFQDSIIARAATDVTDILTTVNTMSSLIQGATQPYFKCFFYNTSGTPTPVICRPDSDVQPCVTRGTVGCSLYYQDMNVTDVLPVGQTVDVCGISKPEEPGAFSRVAYFKDASISQYRALRSILDILGYQDEPLPDQYCDPSKYKDGPAGKGPYFTDRWVKKCDKDGVFVTTLDMTISNIGLDYQKSLPKFDDRLTNALLSLDKLADLDVVINDGTLPPQLGSLREMANLSLRHYCADGPLPPNWIRGWPKIRKVSVTTYEEALGNSPDQIEKCGVIGSVPADWGQPRKNLWLLDLSYNRLSGRLPTTQLLNQPNLMYIYLQNNSFTGQVPYSWANFSAVWALDVSGNALAGPFPTSWQRLTYLLSTLKMDGNKGLTGCIPLNGYTTVTYSDTQISGLCVSTRLDIEKQQADAMLSLLPKVLNARNESTRTAALNFALQPLTTIDWAAADSQGMRSLVQDGLVVRVLYSSNPGRSAEYKFTLTILDTTAYFTAIEAVGAGLDLSLLGSLMVKLPRLQTFDCSRCRDNLGSANKQAYALPADLAKKAPGSLTKFKISDTKLSGSIPSTLGAWPNLTLLDLSSNMLTGMLPSTISQMASLVSLNVSYNQLTGSLPQTIGLANLPLLLVELQYNRFTGPIPASWASLSSAYFYVGEGNQLSPQCLPDGLSADVFWWPSCSNSSTNSSSAQQIQALVTLAAMFSVNQSAKAWDVSNPKGLTGPNTPPAYCRVWTGVTCDASFNVIGLDLATLAISSPPIQQLSAVTPTLRNLPFLQTLNLSGMNLQGNLPPDLPSILTRLQHLNLSNNLQLSGALPEDWAAFSKLQTLDVSACSINGQLPELYATLQELQVFKVVGSKLGGGLTGQLPNSYGLLKNLVELDLSQNALSGVLPAQWANPYSMAQAAAATVAKAKDFAAQAAAAAATASSKLAGTQSPGTAAETDRPSTTGASVQALQQYQHASKAAVAAHHMAHSIEAALEMGPQSSMLDGQVTSGTEAPSAVASSSGDLGQKVHLTQLQVLRLRDNPKLSGVLPLEFVNFPALRVLDLTVAEGKGSINGTLPRQYSMFQQLQELLLSGQWLSGQLPPDWATLNKLTKLHLNRNKLSGNLSPLWASMALLQEFDLSDNTLSGEMPSLWSAWKSIKLIDVSTNNLTGAVPQRIFDMAGDAYQLRCLALYGNSFSNIPEVVQKFAGTKVAVATSPTNSCK